MWSRSCLVDVGWMLVSRAGGTRTPNRRFWRPELCQLSYCPPGAWEPGTRLQDGRGWLPAVPAAGAVSWRGGERAAAGAGDEHGGRGGAGGRGARPDGAGVGEPAAREERAHGVALARLAPAPPGSGRGRPGEGSRYGCAAAAGPAACAGSGRARPGSAGTTRCGVWTGAVDGPAVEQLGEQRGRRRHTARADLPDSSSSISRRRLRPRWRRTLAAATEIPSSSAMASWGRP